MAAAAVSSPEKPIVKYMFYAALSVSVIALLMTYYMYAIGTVSLTDANTYSTIYLEISFFLVVFSYMLARGNTLRSIVSQLGLSKGKARGRFLLIGLLLFAAMFGLEVGIGLFSTYTHITLPTNVMKVLGGMPMYFYVFSFLVVPFTEETLFRGFLVPRIGIIPAALLFAILHSGYASISEFAAALVFGLLAGYIFKKTKSLYPSVLAHALVNLLTVAVLFF
ncbi:MAG: CPBP family intramembrane metalloprotease [Candidatus Marsarchaeota archaeon]|jgi:membrane protease YdiL (CAAX protease family)|nr:CPBP family intramembrane metalloprotease [Candidatus Marsarchaeota archaeon]MCL5112692.1 CPBP family intramembrane metalloprotease [Candidatus Marsarchaeota archaeon]